MFHLSFFNYVCYNNLVHYIKRHKLKTKQMSIVFFQSFINYANCIIPKQNNNFIFTVEVHMEYKG